MAIPNPIVKFTYQDYLNTSEDKRYELLDGDLVTIATLLENFTRVFPPS